MSVGKCSSICSLENAVAVLVNSGSLNEALHLVRNCVERIISEPLCTSQVFGSKTLDSLCQRIGSANFSAIKQEITEVTHRQLRPLVIVYIATKLQRSGGHTRVIEDFIKARPEAQHVILSTELEGPSDIDYVTNGVAKQVNVVFEKASKASYQQRLTWLQKRLQEISPNKVYLFNHHQDSVAVAAIQPEMKLSASFYHHGDHHLCLGVFLPHVEHIDPHPMGYHNCRDVLGIENRYIPLAVDDRGDRPAEWPFLLNGTLVTCTVGRSNKIEIPYFVSYLDLVPLLLKVTKGKHVHIGRLSPWALFKIRRGLRFNGIEPDRFVYIPWVPSVWDALHHYRVDLYIASFPYGGGLTLIEVLGAGIPVALHRHFFSRILSGLELAHSGAFSWRFPEELLGYCASLSVPDLVDAGRQGRCHYEQFHTRAILQGILDGEVGAGPKPVDLSAKFSIESDEWALWMERQVTVKRVISRASYRAFRRFRAWW